MVGAVGVMALWVRQRLPAAVSFCLPSLCVFLPTPTPTPTPTFFFPSPPMASPLHTSQYSPMASLPFSLFLLILPLSLSAAASQDLIRSSCIQASYPNLCVRTLSSYAGAVNTPQDLAQATITVSLSLARAASRYLTHNSALKQGPKRQRAALDDCVEQMADSVEELSRTLEVLQHLPGEDRRSFRWEMNNAETWVSAALTNEDTCLDGFEEVDGEVKLDVKRRITKVAKATSNALYMINRLDGSPGGRKKPVAP